MITFFQKKTFEWKLKKEDGRLRPQNERRGLFINLFDYLKNKKNITTIFFSG